MIYCPSLQCFAVPVGVELSLAVVREVMLWDKLKDIIMGSCRPPWRWTTTGDLPSAP